MSTVAGLPLESWLLLVFAVGSGLVLELAFYRIHRRRRDSNVLPPSSGGKDTGSIPGPSTEEIES